MLLLLFCITLPKCLCVCLLFQRDRLIDQLFACSEAAVLDLCLQITFCFCLTGQFLFPAYDKLRSVG